MTTEFRTGAVTTVAAVLNDDLVGAMMFAAALNDDPFGASDRRGGNSDRGNGRNDKSKLLHDVASPPVKWGENIKWPPRFRWNRGKILNRCSDFFAAVRRDATKRLTHYSMIA
jgi:hypothetical protein